MSGMCASGGSVITLLNDRAFGNGVKQDNDWLGSWSADIAE